MVRRYREIKIFVQRIEETLKYNIVWHTLRRIRVGRIIGNTRCWVGRKKAKVTKAFRGKLKTQALDLSY